MIPTHDMKPNSFRMKRIKAVSNVLRNILFAGLVLQVFGILIFFVVALTGTLTKIKSQNVFVTCSALAALPFLFMVTLNFYRFFGHLKEGRLFDSQTVKCLGTAGKWWIVLGIIQIIFRSLEAYIFSPRNIILSGDGIGAGLIVIFIAWLFREANELKEEQELTV
jgi:hypothetical protein